SQFMRCAIPLAAVFFASAVLTAGSGSALEPPAPGAKAQDLEDDFQKHAAQERKEKFATWMRNYAEETEIRIPTQADEKKQAVELVPNPVFRYSDEERFIPDATLWVWTRDVRPVALQKVEGNNHGGGQMWTICFASLSEDLVNVN